MQSNEMEPTGATAGPRIRAQVAQAIAVAATLGIIFGMTWWQAGLVESGRIIVISSAAVAVVSALLAIRWGLRVERVSKLAGEGQAGD